MTFLCFICNDAVNTDTDDKTRDKYRDVIGISLPLDCQLCYVCCHVVHKLWIFKSVCMEKSLEHPTLHSKKRSIKLQKSDLEIHILCPEKCYEYKQIHSNKSHQYNDADDYINPQYINDVVYIQNDNQYIDDVHDFDYIDKDHQYNNDNIKCNEHNHTKHNTIVQFNYANDFEYIDKNDQYKNDNLLDNEHHNVKHTIEQFNYDANNFDFDKDNEYINDITKLQCNTINQNSIEHNYNVLQLNTNQDLKNDQSINNDLSDNIESNNHVELPGVIDDNRIYDSKINNTDILESDTVNINSELDHNNENLDNSVQVDYGSDIKKTGNISDNEVDNSVQVDYEGDTKKIENYEVDYNNDTKKAENNSDSEKKIKKKSKVFKRIILSLEKQKAELEANRKKKKYVEAEFKCYNCALSFLFKDTYQVHMMRHEESNGEYVCAACTLRFASPALLRTHTAGHAERHACKRCGEVLRPRARRLHPCARGDPPQRVACHLCGNLLKDANGLQQHLKRVHANKASARRYACSVCGDSYTRQGALRTHMIKHINRKFPCDQCPRSYSSPYTLEQHKRAHHTAPVTHRCDTCGAGYASRKSLLAHMRNTSNHSTTTYECPICSRVCPNQKSLASHIQCVHSSRKDYACSLCPARYTNRKSLVRHALAHTERKPARIVVCHLCGNHFKDNSKLNRHIREVCKKAKEEQIAVYS